MLAAIIDQRDRMPCLFEIIDQHAAFGAPGRTLHHADGIHAVAVAIAQRVRRPVGRDAWGDVQLVAFATQAEQRFDDQAIHPAGRAGVPGPAAATDVRRDRIHVRGDDVRLDLVHTHLLRCACMVERIDHAQQFPGAFAIAELGECHRRPDCCVGVLAAVLAHTGYIATDVAGIVHGRVEWRIEQLDQLRIASHQMCVERGHRLACAVGIAGAGKYRPALRDRIDVAFVALRRTQRRAVVEPRAPIPGAVPAVLFEALAQLFGRIHAMIGERGVGARAGNAGELRQRVEQEETQPHALALAALAHAIHAVVPVAAAHQRQAAFAEQR